MLFQSSVESIPSGYRAVKSSSLSKIKEAWSNIRALAKDKLRPNRGRRTSNLIASHAFLAFLIVLSCLRIWPSSLSVATSVQTVNARQVSFRDDPNVPKEAETTLSQNQEATPRAPEAWSMLDVSATTNETRKAALLIREETQAVDDPLAPVTLVEPQNTSLTDLPSPRETSTLDFSVIPLETGSTAALPQESSSVVDDHVALQNAKVDAASGRQQYAIADVPPFSKQSNDNNTRALKRTTANHLTRRNESSVHNATVLLHEAETGATQIQGKMSIVNDPIASTDVRATAITRRQGSAIAEYPPLSSQVTILGASAPSTRKESPAVLMPAVNYKGGSIDVVELSRNHVEPASNITAAVCFKTMFGDIDVGLALQWVGMYSQLDNNAMQAEVTRGLLLTLRSFPTDLFL